MTKNSGAILWNKAKKIIPGGNQLLSKRSEMFLPNLWPSYFKKAKGCEVWDLDGRKYYDFASMGIGSCVLGYANDQIDEAVIWAIKKGSMSTLNSYEEVSLAENLIDLHPWADMVRFARTGGEACAIATRIGRSASGKDKVLFCGYHGWHDWYLSSNISEAGNLDGHLLPGLEPKGVPRSLKGSAIPFYYNDVESFLSALSENQNEVGVVIMEPQREVPPNENFLKVIREETSKAGIVLIFDEVTSGFRINNGGIHITHGVNPDIAVFGKALGNGYPISAVIGSRFVMNAAQDSFISSTFWTERIGFTAANTTLSFIVENNVTDKLIHFGEK
ncbi:aminotransferase class III-fold pyridoxal phosphate-dependent enzyme, partial [candidate division KSB1 bacterium]|nr:aminotransferase class III-fold pyridoxal phosphate-dependent enzyme [candidate division KSB1 bacterium]